MFHSGEVPTNYQPRGINASAYRNADYDQACKRILLGAPDGDDFLEAVQETQQLFATSLPALPLYVRPRIMAHRPEVCGVMIDPSAFSTLWNLEEYASGEACTQ
jgi:ABC-type oligopeptide transport system substrate-binding subunit